MQTNGYETETMKMRVGDGFPTSADPLSRARGAIDATPFRT